MLRTGHIAASCGTPRVWRGCACEIFTTHEMTASTKLDSGSAVVQESEGRGRLSDANRSEQSDGRDLIRVTRHLFHNFFWGETVDGGSWENREQCKSRHRRYQNHQGLRLRNCSYLDSACSLPPRHDQQHRTRRIGIKRELAGEKPVLGYRGRQTVQPRRV